jgi:hypothetical protein
MSPSLPNAHVGVEDGANPAEPPMTSGPTDTESGCPADRCVHEAALRVNVRWVTPVGEETASMS